MKNDFQKIPMAQLTWANNIEVPAEIKESFVKYGQISSILVTRSATKNNQPIYEVIGNFEWFFCLQEHAASEVFCIVLKKATASKYRNKTSQSINAPIITEKIETLPQLDLGNKKSYKNDFLLLGDLRKLSKKYEIQCDVEIILDASLFDNPEPGDLESAVVDKKQPEVIAPKPKKPKVPRKKTSKVDVSTIESIEPSKPSKEENIDEEDDFLQAMADLNKDLMADIDNGILPKNFMSMLEGNENDSVQNPNENIEISLIDQKLVYRDVDNKVTDKIGEILLEMADEFKIIVPSLFNFNIIGSKENGETIITKITYVTEFHVTYHFRTHILFPKLLKYFPDADQTVR